MQVENGGQEAAGSRPPTVNDCLELVKEKLRTLLRTYEESRSREGTGVRDLTPEGFNACAELLELLISPSSIRDRFVWKIYHPHVRLTLQMSCLSSPDFEWPDIRARFRLQLRAAAASGRVEVELLLLPGPLDDTISWPLRARLRVRLIELSEPRDASQDLTGESELFSIERCSADDGQLQQSCCVVRDWPAKLEDFRDGSGHRRFVKSNCAYLEAVIEGQ